MQRGHISFNYLANVSRFWKEIQEETLSRKFLESHEEMHPMYYRPMVMLGAGSNMINLSRVK